MVDPTRTRPHEVRTVGLVASHRAWRSEFARYVQDHITGLRVRILRDPRAIDESIDVVIIDDSSTFLNRESLRQLREAGIQVIGIYDPNEHQGQGQAHLTRMGIADVASAELMASQLVELIQEVTRTTGSDVVADLDLRTPVVSPPPPAGDRAVPETPRRTGHGTVITVGGPSTLMAVEVAVGIAAELAKSRGTTLVMDVDETTPVLAARLGYRLEPTVLDAIERIHHGDGDLSLTVTEPTRGAGGFAPMHVLAGIANPDDWSLLGRDRCRDLLRRSAEQWDQVVALSGPHLLSLPNGVDRYGASQAAVAFADRVVGVCDPTPTGVLLALDWLIETRRLRDDSPVWIAFAGRPRSAIQRADLVDTLVREAGQGLIAGIVFVPVGADLERACWEARVLTRGRFTKSMAALVDELVGPPDPGRRRFARPRRRPAEVIA